MLIIDGTGVVLVFVVLFALGFTAIGIVFGVMFGWKNLRRNVKMNWTCLRKGHMWAESETHRVCGRCGKTRLLDDIKDYGR